MILSQKVTLPQKSTDEIRREGEQRRMGCVGQDGRAKECLHSLWLPRSGWSLTLVSDTLGVHYTRAQWYKTAGMDKMVSLRRGGYGRQPYMDDDDMTFLTWEVEEGVFDTAADVGGLD